MFLEIFAIYDSKTEAFNQPFCYRKEAEAIRAFIHAGRATETPMGAHPDDFTLYHIGSFNQENGATAPLNPIESLGNLLTLLHPEVQHDN